MIRKSTAAGRLQKLSPVPRIGQYDTPTWLKNLTPRIKKILSKEQIPVNLLQVFTKQAIIIP